MAYIDHRSVVTLGASSDDTTQPHSPLRWIWLRRGFTVVFFGVLVVLLVQFGRSVDWQDVLRSARANAPTTLALALALTVLSHAWMSSYDLIGRHVTGHGLPATRVCLVAWLSYAFGLCLGAVIGGAGMRWRLYGRLGLKTADIAQVYGLSVITNWLAYTVLLGVSLVAAPIALPAEWHVGRQVLTVLGAVLPLLALAYLWACAFSARRRWQWRGKSFELPSGRIALLQLLLSAGNWLLIATILYILLGSWIEYMLVLGVTLLAAVAGVLIHVPAGLGVIEAVFVALLAARMPQSEILAAMLTYRALYYLASLLLALISYGIFELRLRRAATGATGVRPIDAAMDTP